MQKNYKIVGYFYEVNGFHFRKYVDIIIEDSGYHSPQMMVIMLNPGSSKPIGDKWIFNKEVEVVKDRTQDRIIDVMECGNIPYARILNLSDLREPKSDVFFRKLVELDSQNIAHSIFDPRRKNDFNQLFIKNVSIIFAWGVNPKVEKFAKQAIKKIRREYPIGLKKEGTDFAYYHPLPRVKEKQDEWINTVIDQVLLGM